MGKNCVKWSLSAPLKTDEMLIEQTKISGVSEARNSQ